MAVAAGILTDAHRRTLAAMCDTFVPAVEPDAGETEAVSDFLRRTPSDLAIPAHLEGLMGGRADAHIADGEVGKGE